jgi:CRISPR-associated protein Csd1
MILHELVRYYDRKARDPDPAQRLPSFGLEDKEIRFVIEVAQDGQVNQLRDTQRMEGKKKRAQSFLVPQGEKKTSGVKANLLWDSAQYVIGLERERKGKAELTPHQAYRQRIEALPVTARADDGIRAVLAALDRADWSVLQAHEAWPEIVETNPVMTFQLVGDSDLVCQRAAVVAAAASDVAADDAASAMCLIDGERRPIERVHASIKGVWGAQSSGANVVSFNARAFESYGKAERQGENAPIGQQAAFAYTTALNHLLGKDSRQRMQVGDASTVFWSDRDSAFEGLFAELFGSHDDPDRGAAAVKALFDSLKSGQLPVGERDVTFFVLGLAPNAARIAIRFWLHAPLAELAPRIAQHFADLSVVRRYDSDPATPSLFRLLTSLAVQGKADNVPPSLAGEWMRSILEGLPYPAALLNAAVVRCKAEQEVTYLRAAILKAWLNRDRRRRHPKLPANHSHFKESLDMQQPDVPYRLGRLFAVLERLQEEAAKPRKLNSTIRDRYFGAASTTPVAVFTTLLRLKVSHSKQLTPEYASFFERMVGEICGTVVDPKVNDFPRQLTLPEQGRFALGYYHQRQSFFAKKEGTETPTEPTTTEEA